MDDPFMKTLGRIFVIMLAVFLCTLAMISGGGITSDFGLLNLPMALIMLFFPIILIGLGVILAIAYLMHLFMPAQTAPRHEMADLSWLNADDKAKQSPVGSRFAELDALLNRLDDEERAYLERKLGTGELILNDDGELTTLEEYRRQRRQ